CNLADNLLIGTSSEIGQGKFQDTLTDLRELIVEGFDLYATDKIIHLRTDVQIGRSSGSPWARIPAFTSEEKEEQRKIDEAKVEFKKIITHEIQTSVNELRSMNTHDKNQYII